METLLVFIDKIHTLRPMLDALHRQGAHCYVVGGTVRDLVLARPIKDIDIEVHRCSPELLCSVLGQFGLLNQVGKKFGVLRLAGSDVDWSLPRRDSKGRKPLVTYDATLTIQQACRRRDVTINAMALDTKPLLGNLTSIKNRVQAYPGRKVTDYISIIDPYNGLDALAKKSLSAIDPEFFVQDPLRFYRVMQFISRFQFTPDAILEDVCRTMSLHDPVTDKPIAYERVYQEIRKLCLQSQTPSYGIRWLASIGRLKEIFPELAALIGVPQRPDYHPEGDVFEHTMQAFDASAHADHLLRHKYHQFGYYKLDDAELAQRKFLLMLATLCHDMGKPETTVIKSEREIHSWKHEIAGVPIAQRFVKRLTGNKKLSTAVGKLVRTHMQTRVLVEQQSGAKAFKRLAVYLAPEATVLDLGLVSLFDFLGRNPQGPAPLCLDQHQEATRMIEIFIARVSDACVAHGPEKPILTGADLLDYFGQGPELGKALSFAYDKQIEQDISDKEILKKLTLKKYKRN